MKYKESGTTERTCTHVCVSQLSYNKKTASDENSDSSGLGQSLYYPSASRGQECPLRGAPPSVAHKTPRTHAQPHICKPLQAPTGQLFKGHLWISRNVKKKFICRSMLFLSSFCDRLFLQLSSLLPCLSASTQKSSCPGSLQLLFPGRCHFFSSTKVQAQVRGLQKGPLTQGIRGKNIP